MVLKESYVSVNGRICTVHEVKLPYGTAYLAAVNGVGQYFDSMDECNANFKAAGLEAPLKEVQSNDGQGFKSNEAVLGNNEGAG